MVTSYIRTAAELPPSNEMYKNKWPVFFISTLASLQDASNLPCIPYEYNISLLNSTFLYPIFSKQIVTELGMVMVWEIHDSSYLLPTHVSLIHYREFS